MPGVIDAQSYAQAEAALVLVRSHPQGVVISQFFNEHLDRILVHMVAYYAGLQCLTPEWYWRDLRLRLGRGRNPGSDPRLRGPPWSGPSTTTSNPPNGGLNANGTLAIPAKAPGKWPAHHPDK